MYISVYAVVMTVTYTQYNKEVLWNSTFIIIEIPWFIEFTQTNVLLVIIKNDCPRALYLSHYK